MRKAVLGVGMGIALAVAAWAQTAPDPQLMEEINRIPAIDDHTHIPKVVARGEKDDDYDALPCAPLEPTADPTMVRPGNPLFLQAWKALYGYQYRDKTPEHVRELLAAREQVQREQGDNFPAWVVGKLNIRYMLANRIAMGPGLAPPRFLWVPYDDALLLPLNNQALASENPDRKFFYGREEMLLRGYVKDSGLDAVPATLKEYVSRVVVPMLELQKKKGAVAIKFEAAYLRTLNFGKPDRAQADQVYAHYAAGGIPPNGGYLAVQDVLFREIARAAGQLGLAVHIHTGAGCGGYFDIAGSNPELLDSVLDDPSLRQTNFVLLHGGSGPYSKVTAFLLGKPNVYTDFSEQDWMLSPRALSAVIRDWLEWYPEKVMFGTDLYPGNSPEYDWDSIGYMIATTGRRALALALTGMVQDGEISRARAVQLAHMVLFDNAAKLYGLAAATPKH
ncbi:MAG TPA: amidohydrolase family protein [Terriglobales bacterium]|jgi:predicted TIM-barrel fold metal-dependent hydrolase|nr:amidohydrolase family protein [Terriglobales bacterium]